MSTSLMRLNAVTEFTGLPRSTLYALIAAGKFPRQIKLSERACAWRADEVRNWIEARTKESRGEHTAAA